MISYQSLYYKLVQSMDDALTCLDKGDSFLACTVLQNALLDAENEILSWDLIPEVPSETKRQ